MSNSSIEHTRYDKVTLIPQNPGLWSWKHHTLQLYFWPSILEIIIENIRIVLLTNSLSVNSGKQGMEI
jgi:hypothetical protein